MAYRLSEYVSYGELICTHHYGVTGFLVLRTEAGDADGDHTFVRLDLTGLPNPDLVGKHICFEPEEGSEIKYFYREEHRGLKLMQVGVTGTMTAQGWVRTLPCSLEEFEVRSRLGEPPPTAWKNHLYLEWFGQNGCTVVELAGVLLEQCVRDRDLNDEADTGEWEPLPNPIPKPEPYVDGQHEFDERTLEIHEIHATGEVIAHTAADFQQDDGGLQRALDAEAEALERAIRGEAEEDDAAARLMAETSLIDECIEHGEETPLMELLRGLGPIPRPESLDDEGVEAQFKLVLSHLALFGVGFWVCKHCSPRDAYRILLDEVLPDSGAFEGLIGTGWTQNFTTGEYCAACDEEAERRFEEYQQNYGE